MPAAALGGLSLRFQLGQAYQIPWATNTVIRQRQIHMKLGWRRYNRQGQVVAVAAFVVYEEGVATDGQD